MRRYYKKDTYRNTEVSGSNVEEAGEVCWSREPPESCGEMAGLPSLPSMEVTGGAEICLRPVEDPQDSVGRRNPHCYSLALGGLQLMEVTPTGAS